MGSGKLYAYAVLDSVCEWELTKEKAIELGRRAIYHAAFRDGYSGCNVAVYYYMDNDAQYYK